MYEWEGTAGKPATKVARIDYDYLHEFDVRQADLAVAYIKQHAHDAKPFFMDVNFMKMHNPNIPAKAFIGKSHLGNYSDAMMELDSNIGKVMDAIRAEAPNTIVIITADNGAWQDAWPDAGIVPFRGEKGTPFEGGFRVPAIMWAPGRIPAGVRYGEMMSHIDLWSTLAAMVGLTPPPHGAWTDNDGKPIYFDSIDNSAYITGKARHSARTSWIYTNGETFGGARADVGDDLGNSDLHIAWKELFTAKDTWLGPKQDLGAIGSYYNLTMDPLREIRHDVQRRCEHSNADHVARSLRRLRQWLGYFAALGADHGVRQVNRGFSEHQALPRRGVERHESESSGSGQPRAFDGYPQSREDHRSWRLGSSPVVE